jgi:hypothetical protein
MLKEKIIKGYVYVYSPNHPRSNKKYVKKSHLTVEKFIGRYLNPNEVIHHINFCKNDDSIENLMIFKNQKEHSLFHQKLKQFGSTIYIRKKITDRWKEFKNI